MQTKCKLFQFTIWSIILIYNFFAIIAFKSILGGSSEEKHPENILWQR